MYSIGAKWALSRLIMDLPQLSFECQLYIKDGLDNTFDRLLGRMLVNKCTHEDKKTEIDIRGIVSSTHADQFTTLFFLLLHCFILSQRCRT